MKPWLICSVILLCVTATFTQANHAQNTELKIGTLNNGNGTYLDGAGCYLKSPSAGKNSNSYIFLSELGNDSSSRAWLNIDGRATTLKFVSSTWKSNRRLRKGSSFTETYRSEDITARVTYVVTKMGEIESAEYAATVVVTKGNRSKIVKAVGECGA